MARSMSEKSTFLPALVKLMILSGMFLYLVLLAVQLLWPTISGFQLTVKTDCVYIKLTSSTTPANIISSGNEQSWATTHKKTLWLE